MVVATEKVFHAQGESGTLQAGIAEVWNGRDRSHILATVLPAELAFGAYAMHSAMTRRLANGRLAGALQRQDQD